MPSGLSRYQFALAFGVGFGLLAVAAGVGGLYVVLTTDATSPIGEDPLSEFRCELDGDPEPTHSGEYTIDQTIQNGTGIDSVRSNQSGDNATVEIEVDGTILNASASRPGDDSPPTVSIDRENATVTVTAADSAPFRLWIDVTRDGAVLRHEHDLCAGGDESASLSADVVSG
ncbi:hypothetical protein [Halalkalirubrum salinum]|uniref:hypothetical protein n=1 Tax=Halalkalirubrum salinum TaxID=2563889 RepID=UPI0010FBB934|nr:hypothetical protein [Halalkalirubrum salinum]